MDRPSASRERTQRHLRERDQCRVDSTGDNVVAGNYIGTDKDGETHANGAHSQRPGHIRQRGSNNRIGTERDGNGDDAERNVISGNTGNVVSQIWIADAPGTVVAGNYIGPDASGTQSLTQAGTAIRIEGATAAGTRIANNLISGIIGGAAVGLVQTTKSWSPAIPSVSPADHIEQPRELGWDQGRRLDGHPNRGQHPRVRLVRSLGPRGKPRCLHPGQFDP